MFKFGHGIVISRNKVFFASKRIYGFVNLK